MTSPSVRPIFEPVDTSFNPARDDVESPSLTNGNALARFEFEPGRSKDGTKVLMVEWEEDESTKGVVEDWEISWEGRKTVLPARDQHLQTAGDQEKQAHQAQPQQPVNRLYFLLGPGVTIPTAVKLQKGSSITWRTNPLPAIFSPELGATARQAGKKGVLHTIWAKKRLQVLQKEIKDEWKENVEGIGLEMAEAERLWIEQNFGVQARPGSVSVVSTGQSTMGSGYQNHNAAAGGATTPGLNSPISPRSPTGGGRLMDKLKGLTLGTSASELAGTSQQASHSPSRTTETTEDDGSHYNPLSPEGSDVALGGFGSFAALKGVSPLSSSSSPSAAASALPLSSATDAGKGADSQVDPQAQPQAPRKIVAQRPPGSFAAQQRHQQAGGMFSLNALASGGSGEAGGNSTSSHSTTSVASQTHDADDDDHGHDDKDGNAVEEEDDDLFALPMSPRSPEMTKSPFTFAAQDTLKYMALR